MKLLGLILALSLSVAHAEKVLISPEGYTGIHPKPLVYGQHDMVVTNNPWASRAASHMLKQGGTAVDAAIAAAFVLGLTEPSASGLGGGGFALTYDQSQKKLMAYDGREIAPESVTPDLFMDEKGQIMPFEQAMLSFKSVGVPGEVALLYQMHRQQGRLKWEKLLQPAIDLAKNGFPMSHRLHALLSMDRDILIKELDVKAIYFTPNGNVKPINTMITNPAYANSLTLIAHNPQAFYTGKIARDIVRKMNQVAGRDVYSMLDLRRYSVIEGDALCTDYRTDKLCSTPFASGGITVLQLMKIYANTYSGKSYLDASWMYHFLEAAKLAYADRNQYIADPVFVQQPVEGLLSDQYLLQRSQLVTDKPLITPVSAGIPKGVQPKYVQDMSSKEHGTTSMAIVDYQGNAVSMTLTVEHQFGSHLFVDGFFLNNELTDFSFHSTNSQGKPIANRVEPLKRPRSSIAPAMVFNKQGELIAISGSPGGSPIICYVAKNLIHLLDFNRNPAESSASGNLCAMNDIPIVEKDSGLMRYLPILDKKGEKVLLLELLSGAVNIKRAPNGGWNGAADPRREGEAIGG